jgi:hypothetical protein
VGGVTAGCWSTTTLPTGAHTRSAAVALLMGDCQIKAPFKATATPSLKHAYLLCLYPPPLHTPHLDEVG